MKSSEILNKLRETFAELTGNTQSAPVALMTATLKDGSTIEVTDMIVGGVVTISGTPAPVGEYELQDGTIIVVGDNGAISEIKPSMSAPEEVAPAMEDMGAKFSAFETSTNEKFAAYESKFASYEQKFSDYEAKLSKAYQVIEGLMNLTQTLADTPTATADPVVKADKFSNAEVKVKDYSILFS